MVARRRAVRRSRRAAPVIRLPGGCSRRSTATACPDRRSKTISTPGSSISTTIRCPRAPISKAIAARPRRALIQLSALILDPGAAPRFAEARRPCRMRAGDHRADPAAAAASGAGPVLRPEGPACRRGHLARRVPGSGQRAGGTAGGRGHARFGARASRAPSRTEPAGCRPRCVRPFSRLRWPGPISTASRGTSRRRLRPCSTSRRSGSAGCCFATLPAAGKGGASAPDSSA